MGVSVEAGTALTAIQRSTPPVQREGVVEAVKGSALAIHFSGPAAWNETDEVVLIMSTPSNRFRATGRYLASQGEVCAFALTTPWRPLNVRSSPRQRANLHARVTSILGQSRQDGRVIDVSLGGMGIWLPVKPGGGAIEVMITSEGFTSHLRCEVVSSTARDQGVVLGVRYAELNHVQETFVRQLVATLAAAELARPPEAIHEAEDLAS